MRVFLAKEGKYNTARKKKCDLGFDWVFLADAPRGKHTDTFTMVHVVISAQILFIIRLAIGKSRRLDYANGFIKKMTR